MSGALQSNYANNRNTTIFPAIAMTVSTPLQGGVCSVNIFRFNAGQIGVKYSNPASFPEFGYQLAWANLPNATSTDIAITGENAGDYQQFIWVYPFNYNTGFGTKYSTHTTSADSGARGVAFLDNGSTSTVLANTCNSSPYVRAWPWTVGTGPGLSAYSNPLTLPPDALSMNFRYNASGSQIAVNSNGSPYVTVWSWNNGPGPMTGWGSKYANPATLPGAFTSQVAFSNNQLAVTSANSPYVTVYPWSGASGFGSKWANPVTLPTGSADDVAWYSTSGQAIAIAHNNSPYVSVYAWSDSTGFGSKYANPSTLPTYNGTAVDFSKGVAAGSRYLAVGHVDLPYVSVYPFDLVTGFGAKSADFTTLPTGFVKSRGLKFSPNS